MYKEVILFLTGKLAQKQLVKVLKDMSIPSPCEKPPEWNYRVKQLGLSVAALMTGDLILRRLKDVKGINKIILPGRARLDLKKLEKNYGVPFQRGPEELRDLPDFFGRGQKKKELNKHDINNILKIAEKYKKAGANIIDLGCLPDIKFDHLEKTIETLKRKKFLVSVDSANPKELLRGGKAGADYIFSLNEKTIKIADEINSIPILIPEKSGNLQSLYNAIEILKKKKKKFIADSVLDPINSKKDKSLPVGYDDSLISVHEKKPFTPLQEINETAKLIKDPNFRIQVSEQGVHVYNRDGHFVEKDPFSFFPKIKLEEDGGHAFYIGVETARAHIAWELGKTYVQDEELKWGCASNIKSFLDLTKFKKPGTTMDARQKMKHDLRKRKRKVNF